MAQREWRQLGEPDEDGVREPGDEFFAAPSVRHAPPFDELDGWARYIAGVVQASDLRSARWPLVDPRARGALWDVAATVTNTAAALVVPGVRSPPRPRFARPDYSLSLRPTAPLRRGPRWERVHASLLELADALESDDKLAGKVLQARRQAVMAAVVERVRRICRFRPCGWG